MSVFNAMIISLKAYVITILVYFLLFAVVGNMQAKAASSEKSNIFEEVVISVAVTDNDNTGLSKALVDYLKETQNVVDPKTDDLMTMNDNVRFSIYDYALIIPQGFEDKILSGDTEGAVSYIVPGTTASQFLLTEKIDNYLSDVVIYLKSGYSKDEAIKLTHDQMIDLSDTHVVVMDNDDNNHKSFYASMFSFNGYTLMMLLCVCCACTWSVMKDRNVSERIAVSGMHFFTRNAAAVGAVLTIGFAITSLVIVVVRIMGRGNVDDKFMYYALDVYALMTVGIGMAYFICSITVSDNLINMIANMIVLSMSFLCGIFVDAQFLSESILKVAHFLPLYWYARALKFINDTKVDQILGGQFITYLVIEVLFALVFFAAGMVISKKKEQYAV